jgi:hypothetical protein
MFGRLPSDRLPPQLLNSVRFLEDGERIRHLLIVERPLQQEAIPYILPQPQRRRPQDRENAEALPPQRDVLSAGKINQLLRAFSISHCYRVEEQNGKLSIRESSTNPPNESTQGRFRQMLTQHLAGAYVARWFQKPVGNAYVPCWEFAPAPTDEDVWRFFDSHLKQECQSLYDYAQQSTKYLGNVPLDEKNIGETHVGLLSASLPKIPVSFPDTDDVFDLCGEVLKLIPERDGRIINPLTRQPCFLSDLTLRKDVQEILSDRVQAQTHPIVFFRGLWKLQQESKSEQLAESVTKKLANLKPAQHEALSSYLFTLIEDPLYASFIEDPLYASFVELLAIYLIPLTQNRAIDEFEARYGIRSQSIQCQEENVILSFTDKDYQDLLKEYGNKPESLPLNYEKAANNTWEVKITITAFKKMVQDNKKNVANFLMDFNRYQDHLIHSESSRFKRKILTQADLNIKKEETSKLIKILQGNGLEETDAKKLIAFRKALPEAAKKLSTRRDEWLWWVMKVIATGLTVGIAHCCGQIWKVEGQEKVNEVKEILRPKRS